MLWGGEAGGGKSDALVTLPLRWCNHPRFNALILRRESTDLGPLLDKAQRLYPRAFPGARFNGTTRVWTFPSGARVRFNHCEHENDKFGYQGDEFNLVGWDELTHFTRGQYTEINSRLRTTDPDLPCIARATSNPGGTGHEWVVQRFGAWLNPECQIEGLAPRSAPDGRKLPPAREGEVLSFLPEENTERVVPAGTTDASSRTFFRSVRSECVQLRGDYSAKLKQLDPVRRKQLEKGNWLVKPAAGMYFKRAWIKEYFDTYPAASSRVRYWDLAAGGDFAAGCRYSHAAPLWCVEDMARLRGTPHQVRQLVFTTAVRDGRGVSIWIEQDPGQAGKDQAYSYTSAPELQGFDVHFRPKRIDKITAFGPVSSQAEAGLVAFVRGAWNTMVFDEAESFPEGDFDDMCDAWSGAHVVLTESYADRWSAAWGKVK